MRHPILTFLACLGATCAGFALQAPKTAMRGDASAPAAPARAVGGGARSASPGTPRNLAEGRATGFATIGRPATMQAPLTSRVYFPGALTRCAGWPDETFWRNRDILREIQMMARRGFIPVEPAGDVPEFKGVAWFPAGWRCYGFVVPGGEKIHIRLHHPNEGWFRLAMMDRWGQIREGMLQNLIPTGNPEVSYKNPMKVANSVYVIVDDPGWMSSEQYPFVIDVDRTWDPAKVKTPELPPVMGIWAQTKTLEPEPDKAKDAKPAPTA